MHKFMLTACACSTIFSLFPASGIGADIERVDPPYWWTGMTGERLQLMFYGDGIAALEPSLAYPGVRIEQVERGDSPNYLFVYLHIADDARPGNLDFEFEAQGHTATYRYLLDPRPRNPDSLAGFTAADAIYLVTPDRFANGDPANDTVAGYADGLARGEPYGRHGGDLAGILEHLDYIESMGFTQLWLNPVLENAMPEASYHGYATTDYYRVDPRFGSNADYLALADAARLQGVGLIMDMIVNHIGREHPWFADPPTSDWINSPGEVRITSHARTTHQDPYASAYDQAAFSDGWFVNSMPDLNQENPLLADYLVQNAIWWIEYLGLAGIRQDTWPYADKDFLADWARRIRQEYPDFNIVGEEWSPNPAVVSYWQAGKENHDGYVSWVPSLMDFPLQMAFAESLTMEEPPWGSVWTPAYEMLGNDYLYPDPFNLVIFPDNHDMSRIATQLGDNPSRLRMALAYYATMRGIPQIYYGTEIMMSHPGTESHGVIRSDFPGGWASDTVNAFTGTGLTESQRDTQAWLKRLLNWRKTAGVIHTGQLMQFTPVDNIYAYFRYDEDATVMVVLNRDKSTSDLPLERFKERTGGYTKATDVLSGQQYTLSHDLTLPPESALILELHD